MEGEIKKKELGDEILFTMIYKNDSEDRPVQERNSKEQAITVTSLTNNMINFFFFDVGEICSGE